MATLPERVRSWDMQARAGARMTPHTPAHVVRKGKRNSVRLCDLYVLQIPVQPNLCGLGKIKQIALREKENSHPLIKGGQILEEDQKMVTKAVLGTDAGAIHLKRVVAAPMTQAGATI